MTIKGGLLAAVLLLTGFASAQIFSVTDLGPSVIPAGVNDRGQVAAMRSEGFRAVRCGANPRDSRTSLPLPAFRSALHGESTIVVT